MAVFSRIVVFLILISSSISPLEGGSLKNCALAVGRIAKNYGDTAVKTLAIGAAGLGTMYALGYLPLHSGFRMNAFQAFEIVIAIPIMEELMFRYAPREVFGKSWKVGVPATILFAAIHDWNPVPIQQLLIGAYFWRLATNKNLSHSIFSHVLHNFSLMAFYH